MAYSEITINNPNPIKRWLQKSRFKTAIDLYGRNDSPLTVLDFGAGNGYLCLELAKVDDKARFLCYEPSTELRMEAVQNIGNHPRIKVIGSLAKIDANSIDVTFSLEVFEHLPERETEDAINEIFCLTKSTGRVIVGVPNEIYAAALYKGLFRMFRRYGDFDARLINILSSTAGFPPKNRPADTLGGDLHYHFHHMGYDHREFKKLLRKRNLDPVMVCSPFKPLGPVFAPEIYYLVDCSQT